MKIEEIITEQEYKSVKTLTYDQFCIYTTRLIKKCVEESLKSLPGVIQHLSAQITYLKTLSEEFYKKNKDLVPHKKLMADLVEKAENDNPGLRYEKVIEIAAGEARKAISNTKPKEGPGRRQLDFYDKRLEDI